MVDDSEQPIDLNKSTANTPPSPDRHQPSGRSQGQTQPWGITERTFLIFMHLSLLTGFMIPFCGLVLPLVMWLTNKSEFPAVDAHGKVIVNWMISFAIYLFLCLFLIAFGIGIFLLACLFVYAIVVVVMAAIKTSEGELWHYPMSIKFLK